MADLSQAQNPASSSQDSTPRATATAPPPSFTLPEDEYQDHPPPELLTSSPSPTFPSNESPNDPTYSSDPLLPISLPKIKINIRCNCRQTPSSTDPSINNQVKRTRCLKICRHTQKQIDRILLEDYADVASFKLARLMSQKAGIINGFAPVMYEREMEDLERDLVQARENCEVVVAGRNMLVRGVKGKFVDHGGRFREGDEDEGEEGEEESEGSEVEGKGKEKEKEEEGDNDIESEAGGEKWAAEKLERPEWWFDGEKGEIVHPETSWNNKVLSIKYPKAEGEEESKVVWQQD